MPDFIVSSKTVGISIVVVVVEVAALVEPLWTFFVRTGHIIQFLLNMFLLCPSFRFRMSTRNKNTEINHTNTVAGLFMRTTCTSRQGTPSTESHGSS